LILCHPFIIFGAPRPFKAHTGFHGGGLISTSNPSDTLHFSVRAGTEVKMIYDFRVIETGVTAEVNLITKSQRGKAATKRQKSARPVQVVQAVQAEKGSLNGLNVLNDLNVWNIPERRVCVRGETELSR